MSPEQIEQAVRRIASLPDSACVPPAVAAAHDGVCEKTVRRLYPTVRIAPNRLGVPVTYLRRNQQQPA